MVFDLSSHGFSWLADAAVRASIPLALAVLLAWGLARRAARVRHATWAMAVFAALLLPALSWLEPRWHMGVLPTPGAAVQEPLAGRAELGSSSTPGDALAAKGRAHKKDSPAGTSVLGTGLGDAPRDALGGEFARLAHPSAPLSSASSASAFSWRTGFFLLWGLGFGLGLAYLVLGVRRSRRVAERAVGKADLEALGIALRLSQELRLARPVELIVSDEVHSPMTFGWRRPLVLMPSCSRGWPAERKEVVLAHELVHVQRRDWLVQVLAQIARAFYWFHPLAWLAYKRMSIERERSCDEGVLALGTSPSVYARHLLDIALGMQGRRVNGTVLAMAHRTQLEGRLMSILEDDQGQKRGQLWLAPVCLLMMGTSGALATARTWAAPQEEQRQEHRQEQQREQQESGKLDEIKQEPRRVPVDVRQEKTPPKERQEEAEPHERHTGSHHVGPAVDFSYFTLRRGVGQDMAFTGRMWGLWSEAQRSQEPIWRNDPRVSQIYAEARPILEELRPYEKELDAIHAEMRPLQERMDLLHHDMEPLHEHQEAVHKEMEPLHEQQEALHQRMEPHHKQVDELHEKISVYLERQDQYHRHLEPFHERQQKLHEEMEVFHRQQDELHHTIEPQRRELRKKELELEQLKRELAGLTKKHARYNELASEIDAVEAELKTRKAELERLEQRLEQVHASLAPFQEKLEAIHRQMDGARGELEKLHERMEPFQREIEEVHERMAPIHEHLKHLHEQMEPYHRRLEEFHQRMKPELQALEEINELMEPFRARMEPIHEAMEPIRERLEPLWERLNAVLQEEVKAIWEEHVERAEGFQDPAVQQRLFESRSELFESASWGWALTREPEEIRLHAGWRKSDRELWRALKALFVDGGWALSEPDTRALENLRIRFSDTLSRVHYRL